MRNIKDKLRLLFRKDRESYISFYRILGFYPRNISLYEQALLHKSSSVKSVKGKLLNNERLEFLGDAILDAVVADIVYKKFEGKREGFLTNTRSKIVQRETLNRVAVQIGLDKQIKFATRQSSHNSYMCGNAFEALVGAIYLDRGYEMCKWFMEERIINAYLNLDKISRKEVNFKSKLIEWSQKNKMHIEFKLLAQTVDESLNPTFDTQITIEGIPAGKGKGYSKKESQQEAARLTLSMLKGNSALLDAVLAAKAGREQATEDVVSEVQNSAQPEIPVLPAAAEVDEEIRLKRFDDHEHTIALAEEAAFLYHAGENGGKQQTESPSA